MTEERLNRGRPEPMASLFRDRAHMTGYVTVAEVGSFSAASRLLRPSKQGLAQVLARYEADLGVTLFVRDHGRGAFPTILGEVAVAQARLILAQMEEADRVFNDAHDALNMLGPAKW